MSTLDFSLPKKAADGAEWSSLFDGRSLRDWDGNEDYWRVEAGAIVGETMASTVKMLPTADSFIIWRGGVPADFELKLQYRCSPNANGGVQYRSTEVDWAKWVMRGYQWDIDGAEWWPRVLPKWTPPPKSIEDEFVRSMRRWTGHLWEDNNRQMLAMIGQVCVIEADRKQHVASVGELDELVRLIREDDWNDIHLIAAGNELIHILNGRVICIVVDNDIENRRFDGLLGLQVHTEEPMKIEFRDMRMKDLSGSRR